MTIRSRRETVTFKRAFRIRGLDRVLPAGSYEVITNEEMVEDFSFVPFWSIATMIKVPAEAPSGLTVEMLLIGSADLSDARRIDASVPDE